MVVTIYSKQVFDIWFWFYNYSGAELIKNVHEIEKRYHASKKYFQMLNYERIQSKG